jgi:DNA polymerase III delta prime subunit
VISGHERVRAELERELPFPAVLLLGPESTGKYLLATHLAGHHAGPGDRLAVSKLTVDAAREAARFLRTVPRRGTAKVVAAGLDGAIPAAQHVLLKVLEEPPSYGRFVLVSSRLPLPTVVSRCVIRRTGLLADAEVAEVLMGKGLAKDMASRLAGAAHGQVGQVLEAGGDLGRARQAVAGVAAAAARGDADALARLLTGWGELEDWLLRQMLAAAASGRPDPLFSAAQRPPRRAARRAVARLSRAAQARPQLAVRIAVMALEEESGRG